MKFLRMDQIIPGTVIVFNNHRHIVRDKVVIKNSACCIPTYRCDIGEDDLIVGHRSHKVCVEDL